MADIEIRNLTKKFDDFVAVKSSSFKINDGEFFVMLGPSGCGKTTTLRMIAGLEIPTSGEVLIDNEDVSYLRASQRDIAFVFQMFALYPHMSVEKNISFSLRMQHVPRKEIKQRVLEVAETLRIKHILKKSVNGLSSGDRQRVALGRALVRKPKVFLMDEPLGALDAKFRELMCEELLLLHKKINATTVYVTHDQSEAMSMADRICVMNHAKILQIGKPLDIYRKPATAFVAGFIGTPAINFITLNGNLEIGQSEVQAQGITICVPKVYENISEENIILGVRPEYIKIDKNGNIKGKVLSVEYLGARQLLRIETKLGILTVRIHSDMLIENGETLNFSFDTPNLMLFSQKSDKAIQSELYEDKNV
jgi:multiple sugar transport system ATP-binding protein